MAPTHHTRASEGGVTLMEINSTMTSGAVETTDACARVWRDRRQPGTRLLADVIAPIQGTTLPIAGQAVGGHVTETIAPAFAAPQTSPSMDVPPFRTGRPPV
jgi:hypothetical protein